MYFNPKETGRLAAQGAYDAAQGTKIPPVVLTGEPYIITEENVDLPPEEALTQAQGG